VKLPYIKWYYRDASADLRILDAEPRCVWYEMLWLMASSDRYGYLERQERPMTDEEIARLSGLPLKVVMDARPILMADGFPSIEPETGIWFCRRMVADAHKRDRCAEAGKRGGGSPLLASSPLATETEEPRTQNPYKGKGDVFRAPLKAEEWPGFDAFYEAYPIHKGRKAAAAAWHRHKPPVDLVMAAIVRFKAEDDDWRRGFAVHPTTFINGQRWNDEPKAAPRAAAPQLTNAARGSDPHKYDHLIERSPNNG
jgi:hypothetical protein